MSSFFTTAIIQRVLILCILASFGVIARKTGIIKEEARMSLANLTINITLPPLIFVSLVSDIKWQRLVAGFLTPFLSVLLVSLAILAVMFMTRFIPVAAQRKGTMYILSSMPNSGFIGFPLILAILGKEGLAYAVLYDIGVTIAFCSIAIFALKGDLAFGARWKTLINPQMIAVLCGLLVNRLGWQLPGIIREPLNTLGNATIPLAMLLTGYVIGGIKVKRESLNYELGLVCFFKLLFYPVLAYLLILPLRLDPLVQTVIIIEAAMPSMTSAPVLIQKYGGDEEFAATGIFLSTVLGIFTIPMVAHFLIK